VICQALYAPSKQRNDLVQASPIALESAFMSMCHFCFRCRRPACPECWDYVHGLCAACVQDAKLPFRVELPPLEGILVRPVRHAQSVRKQETAAPLVSIRSGIFVQSQVLSIDKITTRPERPSFSPEISIIPVTPHDNKKASRTKNTRSKFAEVKTRPPQKSGSSTLKILERLATWFLFLVLLCVLCLIVLALVSPEVNAVIVTILHFDIRTEITYLLQLLHQLFS
jgi:hypothetical protein